MEYIQLFGERRSGTKYITDILAKYFDLPVGTSKGLYGHKHFPFFDIASGTPIEVPSDGKTLFIVVTRDACDWIRSLHRSPYHLPPEMHQGLHRFLTVPYRSVYDAAFEAIPKDCFGDTIESYPDILTMRTEKLKLLWNLQLKAPTEYIRYESALDRDFVRTWVDKLKYKYDLPTTGNPVEFSIWNPTRYEPLPTWARNYITSRLDRTVENCFGY